MGLTTGQDISSANQNLANVNYGSPNIVGVSPNSSPTIDASNIGQFLPKLIRGALLPDNVKDSKVVGQVGGDNSVIRPNPVVNPDIPDMTGPGMKPGTGNVELSSTNPQGVNQLQPTKIPYFQALAQGGNNMGNPYLSKGGKLVGLLMAGLQGAAAGAGSRTFNEGYQNSTFLPIQKQKAQLENTMLNAQVQNLPFTRMLMGAELNKNLADARSKQFVTPRSGGVYNTSTGEFAPGTEPQDKPTDKALHAYVGKDGKQHVVMQRADNSTYDSTFGDANEKDPTSIDAAAIDAMKAANNGEPPTLDQVNTYIRNKAQAIHVTSGGEDKGTLMVVPGENGGPSKLVRVRPGDTVPTGSRTVAGVNQNDQKLSNDEQRRADLAQNMEENLGQLEEIVRRRPDLFGPYNGRVTEAKQYLGTSDPDVAALKTIKEQLGMAMIGAHAMRNAQHVEAAADAILNGMKNSPDALLDPKNGSIARARNSLATFLSPTRSTAQLATPTATDRAKPPAGVKVRDYTQFGK